MLIVNLLTHNSNMSLKISKKKRLLYYATGRISLFVERGYHCELRLAALP